MLALAHGAGAAANTDAPLGTYNYVIGTQTIGASYQFTQEAILVETARAILAMGSSTLKFSLTSQGGSARRPHTLAEAAEGDLAVKAVFQMPFANYVMWVSPLGAPGGGPFAAARLEILALRHQLLVLSRNSKRPRLTPLDRIVWAWPSQAWGRWRSRLCLVQPSSALHWHRAGFRLFWRWKSCPRKSGRKTIAPDTIHLIGQMRRANPLWGALPEFTVNC